MRISYREQNLTLNFFPIGLSTHKIIAYQSLYDLESFSELQTSYPDCIFHRQGRTAFCIPRVQNAKTIGEQTELTLNRNYSAFLRLIRDGLIQAYANPNYRLINLPELKFIDTSKNLIATVDKRLTGISIFPKYTIVPMFLGAGQNEILGVAVDVSTSLDLLLPLSQFSQELDVSNLYGITKNIRKLSNRINYSKNSRQGRITNIKNNEVSFSDNPNVYNISDCYLEPTKVNRNYFVRYLVGNEFETVIRKIDQKIAENVSGLGRYNGALLQLGYLKKLNPIGCTEDLQFTTSDSLVDVGTDFSERRYAERPLFIFDPAKSKKDTWHNRGLMNFGPFDSAVFSKKNPTFIVLYPKSRQSEVNRFLTLFKNGDNSNYQHYFKQGFVKKYQLNDVQFEFLSFDLDVQNISDSYKDACLKALVQGHNYDLAIIFIEERYHSPLFRSDPYLIAKSLFMSDGIPVQEIEFETLSKPGLAYSLDNIGLACYAKMGGIPWTIASNSSVDHELVIGLGSSMVRDSKLSQISRSVGITAVFGSDGNYLFSNFSNEIDYDEYPKELTRSIKQIVSEVAERQAWAKGESLRLVVHQTFKKFKRNEVNSIKNAVSEIGDFSTEFSFVTVGHEHPLTLFDLNQQDAKGSYIPERGSIVPNRHNSALLTVKGSKQMLLPSSSFPKPLLISVHRDSTFNDIEQLTRQVYHFTALSWRAFNPTDVPVTILYSDLIADLMGRLRTVKNWNANIIQSRLRYSRWFL